MASISKLASGKWRARYYDEGNKQHARHFDRKTDAQQWLDEVTATLVTGMYVDPRAGRVTVRQYAQAWEESQVVSDGTARIIDNALRVHILPALGDRQMATILRSDVQGLVKRLSETLQPGSVRNVYDVLFRVMAAAVDDKVRPTSPCTRIALPKGTAKEIVPPTTAEVTAMGDTVPDRYRALVMFLAGSGLRIGEALGLNVSDVDFLRRQVRVERQHRQDNTLGVTKGHRPRVVPLGNIVIAELAAHLAEYPSDDALFTNELGHRLAYRQWKTIWNEARAKTGVGFTTHGLRHFTASALISGGASVKQVQTLLGHASAAITLRTYSHLWPGDEDRTRDVMDAVLSPKDSPRTEAAST